MSSWYDYGESSKDKGKGKASGSFYQQRSSRGESFYQSGTKDKEADRGYSMHVSVEEVDMQRERDRKRNDSDSERYVRMSAEYYGGSDRQADSSSRRTSDRHWSSSNPRSSDRYGDRHGDRYGSSSSRADGRYGSSSSRTNDLYGPGSSSRTGGLSRHGYYESSTKGKSKGKKTDSGDACSMS